MPKMLKITKQLLQKRNALKLALIFSIAPALSCCSGLRKFPTETLIEYDAKLKVCRQYRITDFEHFKFEYVKNISCPSVFGFTANSVPKVLDWADAAQEYARQRCN